MNSNRAMTRIHSFTATTRLVALTALLTAALAVAPAQAGAQPFGISSFSTGPANNQAGAHSDYSTSFALNTDAFGNPIDQVKDVIVNLPSGVVGNPQAIPMCTDADFQNFNCPSDAQVGVLNASFVTNPGAQTTLVSQVPNTTLTAGFSTCELCQNLTISLASTAGMGSGDQLIIDPGAADQDTATIAQVLNSTQVSLANAGLIAFPGTAGVTVADTTVTVASTAGFLGLATITIGSGADQETDETCFFPANATHLTFCNPLTEMHSPGEPVVQLATTGSAPIPIFNMQPDAGHVATLAGSLLVATITIEIDVSTPGDSACDSSTCGLTATISDISSLLQLQSSTLTLWGVPGDPSHDSQRCGQLANDCQPSAVTTTPFMTNPTDCSGSPGASTIAVDSWQNPGQFVDASTSQAPPTGCDELSFSPTVSVAPDTSQADTPAGYDVDLAVPQNTDPYGLATPDVQNVSVTLPAGTALSPAVANGLAGCTDAQFASNGCPDASKVGTVSIATPLLPDHLLGSVYIGSPTPAQMYRLFIIASGDNVTIKLSGQVQPNPSTGQLTAVFDQNPQLPFSDLNLSLFGGPLAALANPESCGLFTTTSDITPYGAPASGPDATPSSSFNITGCASPTPFAPSFSAETINPTAGAYSPFTLTLSRQDTDQELSSITATLPPGLLAAVGTVPLCPDANANAGTCPAASQVGTATVGSGAGPLPLFLSGPVYLTGPYNGGAYGLAEAIPAIAGPYDLGTVVVRQSLAIDPSDAHVTAVSDPFPTILDGVPLRIKTVNLTLNRPNFIVNPTSCSPMSITGAITSVGGAVANVSSPFQVGSCQSLPFFPSLGIKLTGKGQTTSGKHPTLTATLKQDGGQANIASAKVTLPLSLALDPKNSSVVCPYAVAQAVHGGAVGCPANTIVGSATAISPLLSKPLTAGVYLVQGIRFNKAGQQIRTLPSLLVPLRGQIALDLRAQTSVNGRGQLVTTFPAVPDAAVSNFDLTINGGSKGILVITGRGKNICKAPQIGNASLAGHSGKTDSFNITLGKPCTASHPAKTKKHSKKKSGRK
jgi:hypothetical protein